MRNQAVRDIFQLADLVHKEKMPPDDNDPVAFLCTRGASGIFPALPGAPRRGRAGGESLLPDHRGGGEYGSIVYFCTFFDFREV